MNTIRIDEPCSENWNGMRPTDNGAHCAKCSLEVIDFTRKSPSEIRDILKSRIAQKTCGHILPSQLEMLNMDFEAWKRSGGRARSTLVLTLLLVFGMSLFSCSSPEDRQTLQRLRAAATQVEHGFHKRPINERFVLGEMAVEMPAVNGQMVCPQEEIGIPYNESAVDGGISLDPSYIDHLKDQ